jgi:hypothetical protein
MVVIGVAYDGSEQGTKALQKALSIADPKRDIIHLIHAIGTECFSRNFNVSNRELTKETEERPTSYRSPFWFAA